MKNFSRRAACLVGMLLPIAALSNDTVYPPENSCGWHPVWGVGPSIFQQDLGTIYVPRDLPVGSIFGELPRVQPWAQPGYGCTWYKEAPTFTFDQKPTQPIYTGQSDNFGGFSTRGKVFQTPIPGVGLVLRMAEATPMHWWPAHDGNTLAPYRSTRSSPELLVVWQPRYLRVFPAFVKTGPIAPGPQSFNNTLFFETFVTPVVNKVNEARFSATIIQAQCDLTANPVNPAPVQLGQWPAADFTGEGYFTDATDFNITLNNCVDDPNNGVAAAHLRLDGAHGSTPVAPDIGVLSLASDASATGVGIQILRADSTPMPLLAEVDFGSIPTGSNNMVIPLKARYYQTGPTVTRGRANGALSFTVSYK
ncbi:fimbrial protein [Pseudomonas sp. nanlin1]|uniref:fimbrial protein n=1 Tax=Pseudomonas sp. nanlin1 TaxID=3040605 RepID=UPI00388FBDAB